VLIHRALKQLEERMAAEDEPPAEEEADD